LGINTTCWRIFEALKANHASNDDDWRELCYLWSSDFRTHITGKRWKVYKERLFAFEKKGGADRFRPRLISISGSQQTDLLPDFPVGVHVTRNGSYLIVETDVIKIRLNCRRGLAIDALWFKNISEDWLCGTMHHGYYDDINWGADYYTGHLVLESPGHRRITDLEPVRSIAVEYEQISESIRVQGKIRLDCGELYKSFRIYRRKDQPFIDIDYQLDQTHILPGSLRLGYITINPEAFSQQGLFYAVHNGGNDLENFKMTEPINHGEAVSFLVSAKQVLGCTDSIIKLGDHRHSLNVKIDKSASNLAGMINYQKVGDSYICRLIWSAREMDDTSETTGEDAEMLRCSLRVIGERADSAIEQ